MAVTKWRGKSQERLTKLAHIVARNWWIQWNIGSLAVHSLDKGGDMLLISCGNSLPKEGTLARGNHFLWCDAFLMNLCARQ
jgi:hypothetical protein